jgi:hypothetical protein
MVCLPDDQAGSEPAQLAAAVRKPYTRPAIVDELQLETRAGSPIGLLPSLNPLDRLTRV